MENTIEFVTTKNDKVKFVKEKTNIQIQSFTLE